MLVRSSLLLFLLLLLTLTAVVAVAPAPKAAVALNEFASPRATLDLQGQGGGGATTTTTGVTAGGAGDAADASSEDMKIVFALLAFGSLLVWLFIGFLDKQFGRSLRLIRRTRGSAVLVQAFAAEGAPQLDASGKPKAGVSVPGLGVEVPQQLIVGTAGEFRATGTAAESARWSLVDNKADAMLDPPTGKTVRVIGTKTGTATLVVESGDLTLRVPLAVLSKRSGAAGVPVFGSGYGSIIIALALAVVVAVLNVLGTLDGQATAGILGTLAGVVVAERRGTSGSGTGQTTGSPAGNVTPDDDH
jgi:hypothetical protein